MPKKIFYFLPILLLSGYLVLTLVLFKFGPVIFHIENAFVFWGLMFLYLAGFVLGYVVAYVKKQPYLNYYSPVPLASDVSIRVFYVMLLLSFISSIVSFSSIGLSNLLDPGFLFRSIMNGVVNPGEQYLDKISRVQDGASQNKLLNIVLFFIAFSKVLVIPATIYFWSRIGVFFRSIALLITFLPVMWGIYNGTNKPIFDFFIYYAASLGVYFAHSYSSFGRYNFSKMKFFLIIILLSGLGAFYFFGNAMQHRGGGFENIEQASNLNDIRVTENYKYTKGFSDYTYVWFTSYLVQGYYGFSLALDQKFESTFGFGNSAFLSRQAEWLTGIDIASRTYQRKVNKWWGESSRWHSLYSYFANDVHFIGVPIICFFISYYLAVIWFDVVNRSSFYAALLLPLFALLIVFIPANNQVFGFLETLSAFSFGSIFWLLNRSKPRRLSYRVLFRLPQAKAY